MVELRSVALRYGKARVLERIDWTVRQGERWIVLGQNGAGKSALLSLVLGDNPQAHANDVVLFGQPRGSGQTIWDIRERIGCVSPELHLHHDREHSALEVVASGFYDSIGLYRRPDAAQLGQARSWLRKLGLARCVERGFGELSEGERQLLLLARALIKEPALVVLDEPCQGLDAVNRRRFLRALDAHLRRSDATLILVTHDLGEVPDCATHGLILGRGRRIVQGSAEEVLDRYAG